MVNGGQPGTERAALDIKFVKDNGPMTFMKNSSIHDGLGWCVYVYSSVNVTFDNNVFYNCEKFLTRALFSNYFTYTNNLMIFPREVDLNSDSGLYDMVAGLDMYEPTDNAQYQVNYNLIQGTEGNGFVIAGTGCGDDSGFKYNQVNSAKYIGLIIAANNSVCLEASDISIAKTQGGVLSNFDANGLSIKRMILAENMIGTQLMFGRENDDNAFNYESIVFIAAARPNCTFCYNDSTSCSGQEAILSPITVTQGKTIPIDKPTPFGLVSVCHDASFDQKLLMNNCVFINYKLNYTSDSNPNFKKCTDNVIFQQRTMLPDTHANTYLTSSTVINSEINAFANMVEPYQDFLFWRGGCGDFNCTGEKNWVITDVDGTFLGQQGQIIPENQGINISNSTCISNPDWNARMCNGIHYGKLEFQNDGSDQRQRLISPVDTTSANIYNTLNEWREWEWDGPTPRNMRLSRFAGIVELNASISLNFETTVPEELKFKLNKGRNDVDFVIVKIFYERPNIIEVWNLINSTFVNPYRVDQNVNLNTKISQCGANIYNSDNRTIEFVITNREDCKLQVRTVNSVKISVTMDSTIEDFYSNDGEALFVDKIAAFLNIDPSRIRIANVLKGSVIVNFDVVEDKPLSSSTSALDTENTPPQMSASPLLKATATDYENIDLSNSKVNSSTSYVNSTDDNLANVKNELTNHIKKLELGLKSGELSLPAKFHSIQSTLVVGSNSSTKHNDKNKTTNSTSKINNTNITNDNSTKKNEGTNRKLMSQDLEVQLEYNNFEFYLGMGMIISIVIMFGFFIYYSLNKKDEVTNRKNETFEV